MKYPFVQQETENDCGLACLAMIYRFYFKKKLLINDIKKDIFLTKLGINLLELKQLASNYNLLLKTYNINFDKLKSLIIVKPLIIQIYNANVGFHFVVIYKKKKINDWWQIQKILNLVEKILKILQKFLQMLLFQLI